MTTAAAQARYPLTQGVNPWLVTVSVMLPTFMEVLDTAIASVALPYIAGSLSASNSEATWVLTSYLGANLSPNSLVLQQKSAIIATYLGHRIGPVAARPGSYGLIYGLMEQQAAQLAYVDVFRWTAVLALICAACAWLFTKPPKNTEAPPGVH